ncbi:hypothetical protein LTR53_001005 [Teratosphaeriaceae sp. CCFEE 6253]|nr:hypothetical protein LTR53_001005 [Teratosphaeriaceae sp. CCFEE 6253]
MAEQASALAQMVSVHRGGLFEGDIFSVLRASPYVIRSFEGALADGAVDCTRSHLQTDDSMYAHRFWKVQSLEPPQWPKLLLFDAKSTISNTAGHQTYVTSKQQRAHVAFYLGISAANTGFVELVPNYYQQPEALDLELQPEDMPSDESYAANFTRVARLPTSAYDGLDPCGAPHRLPIALLSEAIQGVRRHAQGHEVYRNPWSGVAHPDWKPVCTRDPRWLRPKDETASFTAYERILEVQQATLREGSMLFDFVGIAPFLADFKWIRSGRQYFVQHKVDGRSRALGTRLDKVFIRRDKSYFFRDTERFDFLMYHFEFSRKPPYRVVYFVPEKHLPQQFYTSTATEASFELPEFGPYRIAMDLNMGWFRRICEIIDANPEPRAPGLRPGRPLSEHTLAVPLAASTIQGKLSTPAHIGRDDCKEVVSRATQDFFHGFMQECARRGSAVLVVHARNHPACDFTRHDYVWTAEEQRLFRELGRPPLYLHDLPESVSGVPLSYHARYRTNWYQGPKITAAEHRRLISTSLQRLIIWDLGGMDTQDSTPLLAIVPSEDVRPTESQTQAISMNIGRRKKHDEWDTNTPTVSDLLSTVQDESVSKFHLGEYVAPAGPSIYSGSNMAAIWQLVDQFAGIATLQHPPGCDRIPSHFQHTLAALHTRLALEHRPGVVQLEDAEDEEDIS